MAFVKGQKAHPKAGRPPGCGNKIRVDALEWFQSLNFNPLKNLTEIYKREDTSIDQKIKCNEILIKYYVPQLKAVDVTGTLNVPHDEFIRNLMSDKK